MNAYHGFDEDDDEMPNGAGTRLNLTAATVSRGGTFADPDRVIDLSAVPPAEPEAPTYPPTGSGDLVAAILTHAEAINRLAAAIERRKSA